MIIMLILISFANCFVSEDPIWQTSNYLAAGNLNLINGEIGGKVGKNRKPNATLTF